ncbi:polysaccharide deacetylase family protein [Thermomicrobium sp. CFH 73360]|uniref:polysaccharide deacetylase family protein n=1 Tax=Thermomicrobium sp. CFH 73360 TaxID=2951987 RepID=UPI0020772DA0|nr:polysaccharide deacetylase family protein [Thermomicrobium sp. CFH 73360]MCM8746988.1 polysaccharide deacetylase family protein [Thermomicrobium sp. CFH 73360]
MGRLGLLLALAFAVLGTVPATQPARASSGPPVVYFSATGHHLAEPFLSFWRGHGGLRIFGYPISEAHEREGMLVQYFERARMEAPRTCAAVTDCPVQLTRVGALLSAERREPAFAPLVLDPSPPDTPLRRYFPETGHTLAYGFLRYWLRNGALTVFGYPISEEFREIDPETGYTFTVQYFERARFEWHPEALGTLWEVQLGRLGAALATRDGVDTAPVPRQHGVPDYDPSLFPRAFRLPVLMYHDVGEPAGRYRIPLWRLEQQLDWLFAKGYVTVSLEQAYEALLADGPLPERAVVITFDDGSRSQLAAARALATRNMTATFFVVPGRSALGPAELRELRSMGHEIGSHSMTHRMMTRLADRDVHWEAEASRRVLQEWLGEPIRFFAYPGGDWNGRVAVIVSTTGYQGGLAAWGGARWTRERRWAEPRIEIGGTISLDRFAWYVERF